MGVMYEVNQSTGAIGDPVLDSSTGSGGGGGLTQEEHDALMSLAAYEPNMYDANPTLIDDSAQANSFKIYMYHGYNKTNRPGINKIPVCGYKRIKVSADAGDHSYLKYEFQLSDGSWSHEISATSGWSDWITIPENAIAFHVSSSYSSGYFSVAISLSASES